MRGLILHGAGPRLAVVVVVLVLLWGAFALVTG